MNRKKRRKVILVLMLSTMIASVPVTLSLFFDPQDHMPRNFDTAPKSEPVTGKVLPMLAKN
jgi:hypothetical protein